MPVCEVCDGEDFTEFHGHFYCLNCQTQSQDIRVVEAEDEQVQWTGHANIIREKKDRDIPKRKEKDEGRPWSIYEAYQIIIQHQVEALISLGAQEGLKDVVFRLWVNYLSRLGVAFSDGPELDKLQKYSSQREKFPGTTKKPRIKNVLGLRKRRKTMGVSSKTAEKMLLAAEMRDVLKNDEFYEGDNPLEDNDDDQEHTSSDDYGSEDEYEETHEGTQKRCNSIFSVYKLQMKYTLVFCYIGLLYTNPGTTISDLVRWVRKGQVPYLNAPSLLPDSFKFNLSDWTKFGRGIIPSPSVLRNLTGVLASFLGLKNFPVFPMSELISKYVLMLDLPAEMHSLAINLYNSKFVVMDYKPEKHYNTLPFWEGLALSYILITLKLYLGLNDQTERILSVYSRELMKLTDNSHPLFVWEDWVKYMKKKCVTSDLFIHSSQQHEKTIDSVSNEARMAKDNTKYSLKRDKLYQPEVREKIIEPLAELGKRWENKQKETENQPEQDMTFNPERVWTDNTLMHDDPVGFLLGNYENNEESHIQSIGYGTDVNTKENNLTHQAEQFRKSSLKHLSDPECYLDDLDKHGLSDYTIQSSCASSADEADEEWEPGVGCHDRADWDPDFSPPQSSKSKSNRDSQSNSQAFLKKFIQANVKSIPSRSRVTDKQKYEQVTEQIKKVHENFLLTFDPNHWSDALSYNWLLQVCSQLVDCTVSELGNEVKKVEVKLFAEREDISRRGRYNFKRMGKNKMNYFTKRLKKF